MYFKKIKTFTRWLVYVYCGKYDLSTFFFFAPKLNQIFSAVLYLNIADLIGVKSWFIFIVLLVLLFLTHMKYVNKCIWEWKILYSTHWAIYCSIVEKKWNLIFNSMDSYNGFKMTIVQSFRYVSIPMIFFVTHIHRWRNLLLV